MTDSSYISFKAHPDLLLRLHKAVHQKYGPRGLSKWIREAIEELMAINDYWRTVLVEKPYGGVSSAPCKFSVSLNFRQNILDVAVRKCLEKDPFKQGMQTAVIRTAIIQKLLKEGY